MKSINKKKTNRLNLVLDSDPVAKTAGCNLFTIETRPGVEEDYRFSPQRIQMTHKEAVAVATFLNDNLDYDLV